MGRFGHRHRYDGRHRNISEAQRDGGRRRLGKRRLRGVDRWGIAVVVWSVVVRRAGSSVARGWRAICVFTKRAWAGLGISFWLDAFDGRRIEFSGVYRGGLRSIFEFFDPGDWIAAFHLAFDGALLGQAV